MTKRKKDEKTIDNITLHKKQKIDKQETEVL
jgi:hypothetical protein